MGRCRGDVAHWKDEIMQFYGKCSFDLPALVQSSVGIIDQCFLQTHAGCILTSEFGSSGKMQCRCEKHMYIYTTFTISKNQFLVHVYCIHIKQNLRTPGQKKCIRIHQSIAMPASSLPLGRIDKDESGQLTLEELIQGPTPA